jgi:hypothetical protein
MVRFGENAVGHHPVVGSQDLKSLQTLDGMCRTEPRVLHVKIAAQWMDPGNLRSPRFSYKNPTAKTPSLRCRQKPFSLFIDALYDLSKNQYYNAGCANHTVDSTRRYIIGRMKAITVPES